MLLFFAFCVKVITAGLPGVFNTRGIHQRNGNFGAVPALRVVNTFQFKLHLDLHILGNLVKDFEYRANGIALRNIFCQGYCFAFIRLNIYGGAWLLTAVPCGHLSAAFCAFNFKMVKHAAVGRNRLQLNGT